MKFGKEFKSQMVPEWQQAYMDYEFLKNLLKDILHHKKQTSPPPPSANPSGLTRTLSHYRVFSGLTSVQRSISMRSTSSSHHEDIEIHPIVVNNVKGLDGEDGYVTTYRGDGQDVGEHELIFFSRLDTEFNKVNNFYKAKVEEVLKQADELDRQMNALIAFRIKVDKPTHTWFETVVDVDHLASTTSISTSNSSSGRGRSKRMAEQMHKIDEDRSLRGTTSEESEELSSGDHCTRDETKHSSRQVVPEVRISTSSKSSTDSELISVRPPSLEILKRVTVNKPADTPLSTIKNVLKVPVDPHLKFTTENLCKVEDQLKKAFAEFHHKLRHLKSYSFLNILAFSKIMKKHDKITSRNASKSYLKMVDNSYLGSSDEFFIHNIWRRLWESTTTTMARTRRTIRALEEGTPSGTTQVISSTVEIPPHSTYASAQGEAQTGTTPPTIQGTNPQVQQVHIPVNSRPVGYEYSTIVTTNPPYGMPLHPEVGESGYAGRSEARGQSPPYIRGLGPIPEDREFSGPYTERDSESSDDEVAPRRRRPGKEPMADGRQRPQSTPGANPQEAARPQIPLRGRNLPPVIDLDGPVRRRAVVPRTDPSNLLPLGDPDDPTPPFTEEIMNAHISRKFKMPTIKAYDGTGDPANHVRTFSNALLLQPVNDAIKCRAFPQTLSGMAQRWYSRLPPNSIGSFRELSQAFIKQFISGRVHEKSSASLMSIVQGAKETLRDYLNRFTKEALKVPDLDDKVAMIALQQGTRDEFFKMSLAKRPPENMLQLQERAEKYIKVEESMRKTAVSNEPTGGKKRKTDLENIAKDKYPRTE
ncbi:hypothetical protein AgCh_028738 [Apium graveolens]